MVWDIKGYNILIDDEDYERLKNFNYFLHKIDPKKPGLIYFNRNVHIHGKRIWPLLHRDIMQCTMFDGKVIDHINGNTLDNRKVNLRVSSHTENIWNQKLRTSNTSGVKGVSWSRRREKWQAQIMVNRKAISLGFYTDIEDARNAYAKASAELHGEFGRVE